MFSEYLTRLAGYSYWKKNLLLTPGMIRSSAHSPSFLSVACWVFNACFCSLITFISLGSALRMNFVLNRLVYSSPHLSPFKTQLLQGTTESGIPDPISFTRRSLYLSPYSWNRTISLDNPSRCALLPNFLLEKGDWFFKPEIWSSHSLPLLHCQCHKAFLKMGPMESSMHSMRS